MEKENVDEIKGLLLDNKKRNEDGHQKNFTFITAGALAVSISFISNVVHLPRSHFLFLLVSSWSLLTLSLIINLLSLLITAQHNLKMLHSLGEISDDGTELKRDMRSYNKKLIFWDWATMLFSISAIILLITFCSINIYNMPDEKNNPNYPTFPGDCEKKGFPYYVPANPREVKPPQPAPAPPPAPAPEKKD